LVEKRERPPGTKRELDGLFNGEQQKRRGLRRGKVVGSEEPRTQN